VITINSEDLLAQEIPVVQAEFAWPEGDLPGVLDFRYEPLKRVTKAMNQALMSSFSPVRNARPRYFALRPSKDPIGCYQLMTKEGSWFVRVSSRARNSTLRKSIIDYLIDRGVSVCPLLVAGETMSWAGRSLSIDVSPLIEGRHFINGLAKDLHSVARTVAACHRAMIEFPKAQEVRAGAAIRYQRLRKVCERVGDAVRSGDFRLFAEHSLWAAAHRDWLAEMVDHFDRSLDECPDAQCVHGEIHPGNVLFQDSDGAAVLIDFEESTHLFMPPTWDLSFLVQRFCLRDNPSISVVMERLSIIGEGYGSSLPKLAQMIRQAAWFTMATIVDLRVNQGVVTPVAECEKFVELERQAIRYKDVI